MSQLHRCDMAGFQPSTATVDKRRRRTPGDYIDPKTLNPLARSYLREAFPAVASVRSGLANELSLGVR
jgi:Putative nucleotidyltransferase substrate binding domain